MDKQPKEANSSESINRAGAEAGDKLTRQEGAMDETQQSQNPDNPKAKHIPTTDQEIRKCLLWIHTKIMAPEQGANLFEVTDEAKRIPPNPDEQLDDLLPEDLLNLVYSELLAAGIDDPEQYLRQYWGLILE